MDFWASWCGPCRSIEPAAKQLEADYAGRVDLWKVNADQAPDLLRALHVFGIPTLIAFRGGQEVVRRTGAISVGVLAALFESALTGRRPERNVPSSVDRLLRLGSGLALIGLTCLGGATGMRLFLAGTGALVMFMAVYDRCPVYRMVSARIREIFLGSANRS